MRTQPTEHACKYTTFCRSLSFQPSPFNPSIPLHFSLAQHFAFVTTVCYKNKFAGLSSPLICRSAPTALGPWEGVIGLGLCAAWICLITDCHTSVSWPIHRKKINGRRKTTFQWQKALMKEERVYTFTMHPGGDQFRDLCCLGVAFALRGTCSASRMAPGCQRPDARRMSSSWLLVAVGVPFKSHETISVYTCVQKHEGTSVWSCLIRAAHLLLDGSGFACAAKIRTLLSLV